MPDCMNIEVKFEVKFEVVCTCGRVLSANTFEEHGVQTIEVKPCDRCIGAVSE